MKIIKNIFLISIWILLIPICINYFGLISGILIYTFFTIIWNILMTIIIQYIKNNKKIIDLIKIMFSTNLLLPFTLYGCYCSPKYGVDGKTNGLIPVDDLDNACYEHDVTMLELKENLKNNILDKEQYIKLANKGDFDFMKKAINSNTFANGVYLLGLEIGFLFRIIKRTLF